MVQYSINFKETDNSANLRLQPMDCVVKMRTLSVNDIFKLIGNLKYTGNREATVEGLNLCNRKTEKSRILSYAVNGAYRDCVESSQAVTMLITTPECASVYEPCLRERNGCLILTDEPEEVFYRIHEALCRRGDFYETYEFQTQIGEGCSIHRTAVIDEGVHLGNHVTIGALSVIKSGTIIEDHVTIGCNCVIGSEGFQIIQIPGKEPLHISHAGKTHLHENAYIGDCVCISKSLFEGETYIGRGVKIDNLVYVGHNVRIEENVVITAHVDLCGSSIVKKNAWVAPNASVLNRVVVGEHAKVGAGSVVTRDVSPASLVYGVPAKTDNRK